jgi:hypothetical protein
MSAKSVTLRQQRFEPSWTDAMSCICLSSWRKLLWNWCVIQEFTAALLQDNFHADFLEATKTILINFRQKRKKLVLYVSGKTLHFPSKIGCFAYLIFSLYGFKIYIQRQIENHVSEITHLRRDMSCLAWRVFFFLNLAVLSVDPLFLKADPNLAFWKFLDHSGSRFRALDTISSYIRVYLAIG